jgi:hypothetical protein
MCKEYGYQAPGQGLPLVCTLTGKPCLVDPALDPVSLARAWRGCLRRDFAVDYEAKTNKRAALPRLDRGGLPSELQGPLARA